MKTPHSNTGHGIINRRDTLKLGSAGVASALLSGCGMLDRDSAFYQTAQQVWPDQADPVDVDKIAAQLPYASVAVSVADRPVALMVLGTPRTHGLHWIAADGAVIATKGAFINRTVGLERNVSAMRFLTQTNIYTPGATRLSSFIRRQCDLTQPDQFNLVVTGQYRLIKEMTWTYNNRPRDILHVEETLSNRMGLPTLINQYWLDKKTGFCWETVQIAAPGMPHIHIRVLKHYSG